MQNNYSDNLIELDNLLNNPDITLEELESILKKIELLKSKIEKDILKQSIDNDINKADIPEEISAELRNSLSNPNKLRQYFQREQFLMISSKYGRDILMDNIAFSFSKYYIERTKYKEKPLFKQTKVNDQIITKYDPDYELIKEVCSILQNEPMMKELRKYFDLKQKLRTSKMNYEERNEVDLLLKNIDYYKAYIRYIQKIKDNQRIIEELQNAPKKLFVKDNKNEEIEELQNETNIINNKVDEIIELFRNDYNMVKNVMTEYVYMIMNNIYIRDYFKITSNTFDKEKTFEELLYIFDKQSVIDENINAMPLLESLKKEFDINQKILDNYINTLSPKTKNNLEDAAVLIHLVDGDKYEITSPLMALYCLVLIKDTNKMNDEEILTKLSEYNILNIQTESKKII